METALKVFSWIAVVIGILAILGSVSTQDSGSAFIGGALFLTQGVLALAYIDKNK